MKEFHEIVYVGPDVVPFRTRRRGNKLVAHVVGTAARWSDDALEGREVANEQLLGGARLRFGAAVRHRLSAAGLIERIVNLDAELFEQLQSSYANLRIEDIDVTRDHQTNAHVSSSPDLYLMAAEHLGCPAFIRCRDGLEGALFGYLLASPGQGTRDKRIATAPLAPLLVRLPTFRSRQAIGRNQGNQAASGRTGWVASQRATTVAVCALRPQGDPAHRMTADG